MKRPFSWRKGGARAVIGKQALVAGSWIVDGSMVDCGGGGRGGAALS